MEKPFDLDHFFNEQDARMNLSESDWDEYEERRRQERKRKREAQQAQDAASEESLMLPLEQIREETEVALKKRKVLDKKSAEHVKVTARPETRQDQQPVTTGVSKPSTSSANLIENEVSVSSSHRRKVTTKLPKPVEKLNTSTHDLSNVTTPFSSEVNSVASASTSSRQQILPNVKPTRRPITEAAPVIKKPSTNMDKKPATSHRVVKTVSAATLNRRTKKVEDKEALMTPMEYAAVLHEKWQTKVSDTPSEKLFLKDCTVLLVFEEKKATKDIKAKLDIIARNGGQVATSYDPATVTHIIPGGSTITRRKILKAVNFSRVTDIPAHIHTVGWDWIVSGLMTGKTDSVIMHELYKERLAVYAFAGIVNRSASSSKGKGKEVEGTNPLPDEFSVIEDFSIDSPPVSSSKDQSTISKGNVSNISNVSSKAPIQSSEKEDPLLPFYAKARQEADDGQDDEYRSVSPVDDPGSSKLKGFQCDTKGGLAIPEPPNWDVIEKLAELREMHRELGTDDDKWRVLSYQKAIGSLKKYPTRIKSRAEAMKLSGISSKTADKIMEIIRTGELQRIKYTKTRDLDSLRVFTGIYGVGSNTARKWIAQGCRNLEDLRAATTAGTVKLTHVQEIGLQYYDGWSALTSSYLDDLVECVLDVNDRMPRQEAAEIFMKIRELALTLDPKLSLEIMGSFRRGKATCGDIDILLTRPTDDGKTHAGIMRSFYDLLKKHRILCEDLAIPEDWNSLEITYRGLCRKDESSRRRRIDILGVPYETRGAARIYYTGDDIFNRSIRLKANKMDMSLNQRGLFQGVIRDVHDRSKKLHTGTVLCSDSERRIFEILGVPWQEPHERVRS